MTDVQSDRRTDGPTDEWTDERTNKAKRGVMNHTTKKSALLLLR